MVSHRERPVHVARYPLHAVLRTRPDVPGLRRRVVMRQLRESLQAGGVRANFRLVHYSVQGNHLHLVVEAHDKLALSRGMQGLAIRIARAVNRAACRKGLVFADHYFARELKTPAEVRRAAPGGLVADAARLIASRQAALPTCPIARLPGGEYLAAQWNGLWRASAWGRS